jgi:hypothetical protein
LCACLWLAACTAASPDPGDLPLYQPRPIPSGILVGELAAEGDCVFLDADDGTRYGIAWPAGRTSWDEEAGVVAIDDSSIRIGDRVELGGGAYDLSRGRDYGFERQPTAECLGDMFFFAVSISTVDQ